MPSNRRVPPLWSVEDIGAAFVVKDSTGQKLAYLYCEEEPGRRSSVKLLTKDEARRIAEFREAAGVADAQIVRPELKGHEGVFFARSVVTRLQLAFAQLRRHYVFARRFRFFG